MAALLLASALLVGGCSDEGSGPADPDPDPEPGPEGNARLTFVVLIPATEERIAGYAPDWSNDGSELVHAGPPGSTIWRVDSRTGESRGAVTDPELGNWLTGAYAPGVLHDDNVAYSLNWHGNELGMFLLVAPAGCIDGEPGPELLHLFSGTAVGLAENQFSSPMSLTYSASGRRAAGVWRDPWVLDWSADTLRSFSPHAMTGGGVIPRISRDGERLVFNDADGAIVWMGFDEEIGENVGRGSYPSWRDDGLVIGFLGENGHFGVYSLETRRTIWYRLEGPAPVMPVLSRDGRRVAYLFFDAEWRLGLAVGDLLVD